MGLQRRRRRETTLINFGSIYSVVVGGSMRSVVVMAFLLFGLVRSDSFERPYSPNIYHLFRSKYINNEKGYRIRLKLCRKDGEITKNGNFLIKGIGSTDRMVEVSQFDRTFRNLIYRHAQLISFLFRQL